MKKAAIFIPILLALLGVFSWSMKYGLPMVPGSTPWASIDELGTVLKSGESLAFPDGSLSIRISYVAPLERSIEFRGLTAQFNVSKSHGLNGIFCEKIGSHSGKTIAYEEWTPPAEIFGKSPELYEWLRREPYIFYPVEDVYFGISETSKGIVIRLIGNPENNASNK